MVAVGQRIVLTRSRERQLLSHKSLSAFSYFLLDFKILCAGVDLCRAIYTHDMRMMMMMMIQMGRLF